MYDLLIIGGGPAAVTAAIYAARKQMKFAVIAPEFGGEVANTTYIENYPGFQEVDGKDLAKIFTDHMKKFNVEIIEDMATKIEKPNHFKVTTYGGSYESKTVILTTGSAYKTLGVPGEEEFKSRGVTYCSICDGPLFKDKVVTVVGAGNSGLTSVLYMLTLAKKVYLINKYPDFKADPIMVEKALKNPNLEVIYSSKPTKITGDKLVQSITIVDDKGQERIIPTDGVIVNIGYNPNTDAVKDLVQLNKMGYIPVDRKNMSNIPGFFAAGDVTDVNYKQIVIAAGEGANALLGAYDYLSTLKD